MADHIGGAPELLQARMREQQGKETVEQPVAPPAGTGIAPELAGQPPAPPIVTTEGAKVSTAPVTPIADHETHPISAFPDPDVKALADSAGVPTTPFDRAVVIAALAAKGITHAKK